MTACLWCERPFTPRSTGGRAQRFCRPRCRRSFHAAARRWVLAELAAGRVTLAAIRNGSTATRALPTGTSAGSGAVSKRVGQHPVPAYSMLAYARERGVS